MWSQVFLKGKSPVLVEDWSCLFYLYNVIPSVWNDFISMRWCYDERELEVYNLKRDYGELAEVLEEYLNKNDLIFNTKVTDPILKKFTNGDLTDILNVDLLQDCFDKMDDFDFWGYDTQSMSMCVNKIEKCYVKPRLIFDDGG